VQIQGGFYEPSRKVQDLAETQRETERQTEREVTEEEEELATARFGCSVPLSVACIYKGSKKNTL
jgi:hypothetical protein